MLLQKSSEIMKVIDSDLNQSPQESGLEISELSEIFFVVIHLELEIFEVLFFGVYILSLN